MLTLEIKDDGMIAGLARMAGGLKAPRGLMRALAGVLESETEANFAAQGRPAWLPLKPATLRRRRGTGAKILQDSGRLAGSIATDYGTDFARIGSNVAYARIHQLGGTIERATFSSWGAHRLDRSGNLVRQGTEGRAAHLAVFAKGSHKRVRAFRYTVGAHAIEIPARPYLPALPDGTLQPAAAERVLGEAQAYLRSLGGA